VVKKGGVEKQVGWWLPLIIAKANNEPNVISWLKPDQHYFTLKNIYPSTYLILNPGSNGELFLEF
jgi:hypothetical protein